MGREFSSGDYDEAYPPGYELHYWHRARSAIVESHVRAFCDVGDTILEIGAGLGHYVSVLRKSGFDAYGCDPGNPPVHEEVRPYFFAQTDFSEIERELRERTTTVLLLDVIEHIEEPATFIEEIFSTMPKLRLLVITVPARQELWSNYDEHFRHFRRYDATELRRLALRSRLLVRSYSYFFHALYLAAWILKKIGRDRETAFAAPKISWLHRLLGYAFWIESQLLPRNVFGTSLICVCTRET